jgi:copper chaperone
MFTATHEVTGMTCSHCVSSVTAALTAIDGIASVDVDLAWGEVTVTSDAPVVLGRLDQAITAAGYQLVPQASCRVR